MNHSISRKAASSLVLAALLALGACKSEPTDPTVLAKAKYAAADYAGARAALLTGLKNGTLSKDGLMMLARIQLRLRDGEGALGTVERLKRAGAVAGDLVPIEAEALLYQAKPDEALSKIANDQSADGFRIRAAALMDKRDLAGALDQFSQGYTRHRDARLAHDYARFLFSGGDLAGALAQYKIAKELAPNDFDTMMLGGDLTTRQSDFDTALGMYRDTAKRFPSRIEPLIGATFVLQQAGRIDEAKSVIDQAKKVAPDDVRVFAGTVMIDRAKGEWKKVRDALAGRESMIDPTRPVGMAYAEALMNLGQVEQARAMLQRAHSAAPENGEVQMLLARAQLTGGDGKAALATIKDAAESALVPRDLLDLARRAAAAAGDAQLSQVYATRISDGDKAGRFDLVKKIGLLEARADWPAMLAALRQLPASSGDGQLHRHIALAASRSGQHVEAVSAADAALAADPQNPDMMFAAGLARFNSGSDLARAKDLLSAAATRVPGNFEYRLAVAKAGGAAPGP